MRSTSNFDSRRTRQPVENDGVSRILNNQCPRRTKQKLASSHRDKQTMAFCLHGGGNEVQKNAIVAVAKDDDCVA
jgi:hypothetical protein